MKYQCGKCKEMFNVWEMIESLQLNSNGAIQIRGECPKCRAWAKWIPYSDSKHVRNILDLFYHNDIDALKELQKEALFNYKKKEIQ